MEEVESAFRDVEDPLDDGVSKFMSIRLDLCFGDQSEYQSLSYVEWMERERRTRRLRLSDPILETMLTS